MIGWNSEILTQRGYEMSASIEHTDLDVRDPDLLAKMEVAKDSDTKIAEFLALLSDDPVVRRHQFRMVSGAPINEAVAEFGAWTET